MGALVSLANTVVAIEPGGVVTTQVHVRNTGATADLFTFAIEGAAGVWTTVEPGSLSLLPGADGVVQLTFAPPRSAGVAAGEVPFVVRVMSREEPGAMVVEQGTAQIAGFRQVTAELVPHTSRGRRGGRHDLVVDNRGNSRVSATLSAIASDNAIVFSFEPPALAADPGTATYSRLRVAARKRFFSGPSVSHPFQVLIETDGAPPMSVEATFLQEPILSQWVAGAAAALVGLVLVLFLFWLGIIRPELRSEARRAVNRELRAGGALSTRGPAQQDATGGAPRASGTAAGTPIDGRLFLKAAGTTSFEVPSGKSLSLTDIVLENPAGNTGTLQLQRDGTALLVVGLDNFRDLDYHFVSPIVFTAGQKLELVANCTSIGCSPGAYFSGLLGNAST